ncbi:MAG: sodium:solute symporter family protein [candidate division WOR-3 bacterium]
MLRTLILAGYLLILAGLGLLARRRRQSGDVDFFLASRSIGPVLMLLTMAATNFSAFTVLGFAGEGYRHGYAYYPIMAFGTGFMAVSFLFIGIPANRAARACGAVTPPELIYHRFRNRALHAAFLACMIVFTLPYLAVQPLGAGIVLQKLLGIPYSWGAALVVAIGTGYLLLAGLRGDALTDALQGAVMLLAMALAFVGITRVLGGFTDANLRVYEQTPTLFGRPGAAGQFTLAIWFSYMALWLLCDPLFPQLFQRFMAARDDRSLHVTAALYPLVTGLLFFLPVATGVLARLIDPALKTGTDKILPLAVDRLLPPWTGALVTAGALAALMSTMDSQLLTLSSMVVRDLRLLFRREPEPRFPWNRLAVAGLGLAGLILALRPPGTILDILTKTTFSGLAVLFPVTLAAVYWRQANPWAGIASIVAGETVVMLCYFRLLPDFGLLPAIPAVVIAALVLVVGSLIWPATGLSPWATVSWNSLRSVLPFALLFLLAVDFWNWNRTELLWLGLPGWLWYFFGLQALLLLMLVSWPALAARAQAHPGHEPGNAPGRS